MRHMCHYWPCNYRLPMVWVWLCLSVNFSAAGIAQNWEDPALQQPVRQYYSESRYPLDALQGNVNELSTGSQAAENSVDLGNAASLPPIDVSGKADTRPGASQPVVPPPAFPAKTKTGEKKASAKTARDQPGSSDRRKKSAKEKSGQTKSNSAHHPVKTWDVYRDRSRYPVDPRKPCSICKRAVGDGQCRYCSAHGGIGNQGRPWQDVEPGGRACGKHCGAKRPQFSVYWPRPMSATRANRGEGCPGCGHAQCRCRKVNDLFDQLVHFSLVNYRRTDNGYFGPGADPWGCPGESRSQVAGVGYRFPAEPLAR